MAIAVPTYSPPLNPLLNVKESGPLCAFTIKVINVSNSGITSLIAFSRASFALGSIYNLTKANDATSVIMNKVITIFLKEDSTFPILSFLKILLSVMLQPPFHQNVLV